MPENGRSNTVRFLNLLFALSVAAAVLVRIIIFLRYNMVFVDGDQPIMWLAARDFSQGVFSEPRFYAQDYNTHMESLFAVPLLWAGVPVYYALPVATHFLFLFPYVFAASYLFYKRLRIQAIMLLGIMLLMPAPFDLMNGLSRGFVTGLFFASFFVINILEPRRLGYLALNTVMAVTGFFVSPISLLATIPFSVYCFLFNYRNRDYYKVIAPGLILFFPLHLVFDRFYLDHPDYILIGLDRTFSFSAFWSNISHLDLTFSHLTFFAEGKSVILLAAWACLLFFLWRGNRNAFWAFVCFLGVLLGSFFLDKSLTGTNWVYGARCRLYLPIPFVMGMMLATVPLKPRRLFWILPVPLIFSFYKIASYEKLLAWHFDEKNFWGVNLITLEKTLDGIDHYRQAAKLAGCDFMLVSGRFWLSSHVAYGGPAVHEDYPATQLTNTERRYRVRLANEDKVYENFLFITIRYDFHESAARCTDFRLNMLDHYGKYQVLDNQLKNAAFIDMVNNLEERVILPCH